MTIQLYGFWRSNAAFRVRVALALKNLDFEEIDIDILSGRQFDPGYAEVNAEHVVPTLVHDGRAIFQSLAIIEYLAEKFPEAKLWPADRAARAHARAISAEMHSGFVPLRSECGMNLHRPIKAVALSNDARANVARIEEIWADCHARYGRQGPFLFGAFSAADAMYAPVVHRFRTYAIPVKAEAQHYVDAMMALPAFQEWTRDGLAETLRIDRFEDA